MDDADKIIGIVRNLLSKTEAGLVTWKEGGEDEYFTSVSTGSVIVAVEEERGLMAKLAASHLVVRVRNKRGSLIISARADRNIGFLSQEEWSALVNNLYLLARRNALKVEAVLDGVLDDVEAIGIDLDNEDA